MHPLILRHQAVTSTITLFADRPLEYGRHDCARMVAHCLRAQGVRVPLASGGSYSSAVGAARALRRLNCGTLSDAIDRLGLPRIAPATALPGDPLALPAPDGAVALFIAVGNGRAFGYFDGKFQIGQPHLFDAAWRSI